MSLSATGHALDTQAMPFNPPFKAGVSASHLEEGVNQLALSILRNGEILCRVPFDPGDTLSGLKQKVYFATRILEERQRIVFAGRVLRDNNTLEAYGIQAGCELELGMDMSGGAMIPVKFTLPDAPQGIPVRVWVKDRDPAWVKIQPGFNLRGRCTSTDPAALCRGKITWKPFGFSAEFRFNMNKICSKALCVCCGSRLDETVNVALFRCRATIEGQYKDEKGSSIGYNKEWVSSKEWELLTFDDTLESNIKAWEYLEFEIKPLESSCVVA